MDYYKCVVIWTVWSHFGLAREQRLWIHDYYIFGQTMVYSFIL